MTSKTSDLGVNRSETPLSTEHAIATPNGEAATITPPAQACTIQIAKPTQASDDRERPTTSEITSAEALQEIGEAAPQLQQHTLVPRLLISSPYTSSPSEFLLTKEATNVGRASANDLLLNDDNLTSRYHALFKRVEARVLVFDKHSNNGVFVNGQRIAAEQDCELADGDHISIGSYELIYRAPQPKQIAQLI